MAVQDFLVFGAKKVFLVILAYQGFVEEMLLLVYLVAMGTGVILVIQVERGQKENEVTLVCLVSGDSKVSQDHQVQALRV